MERLTSKEDKIGQPGYTRKVDRLVECKYVRLAEAQKQMTYNETWLYRTALSDFVEYDFISLNSGCTRMLGNV